MFSKLFSINLTETNETYIVSGINGRDIGKFISKVWKTSVLESYMFKSITGGRFGKMEFYKFFLIDVIYMLEKLASQRNPRVPVRTLNEIVTLLKEQTWFKDVNNLDRLPNKLDYSKLKDFNFKPLPHQQRWLDYYNKTPTAYKLNGALANVSPGGGKGLYINTPIKIPNGWKLIKELEIGDKVNTPNGDEAEVIGIYDHENLRCFKITFEDGRECVCDESHLWEIYNASKGVWVTISMSELLAKYRNKEKLYIPLIDPTHSADKDIDLPVDPYTYGCNVDNLTDEHIPDIYMNASFNQRLTLVQGLMDSYGDIDGCIIYHSFNKSFHDQIKELLYSIGCKVTTTTGVVDGYNTWGLNIQSQLPELLFRTKYKKNRLDVYGTSAKSSPMLKIKSIVKTASVPTRCITVDHPDKMFVIKDYICTHNTYISTSTMHLAGCDRIIVVCPKNAVDRVWFNDPIKFFKTPIKIWNSGMNTTPNGDEQLFVYHYEAIDKILEHHRNDFNKFNYGFILDECHNLNDIKAQRTLRWLETLKVANTSNIIHMSGTPLKAMGAEIIPLLRAIDPSFTDKVEERFKKIYGTSAQKGLDILKNRLGLISYVATKDEFQDDKPEIILQGIKIPDGDKYTLTAVKEEMKKFIIERVKYYESRAAEDNKLYRDCLAIHESKIAGNRQLLARYNTYLQYVRLIQNTTEYGKIPEEISYCKQYEFKDISSTLPQELVKPFRDVCSVIKYLTLKIQGECLGQVVGKMRVQAHVAMCDHIPFRDICQSTKKKTVVFTSFVEVLEKAMETCRNQELNPILVYGKTNKDLAGQVKKFEVDESVNPLIATYNSLSTAVPLIMADTMIMINAPFRAYIQEQAIARIHRLGQDSKCVVYQLYLDTGNETNISSRSLDIMTWSQQQVEAMTGVKSPYAIETNDDGSTSVSAESYFEGDLDSVYYLD